MLAGKRLSQKSNYLTHGFAAGCEARLAAPYAYFLVSGLCPRI